MSLEEGIKKAFMAGVGLTAFAVENAGKAIDSLAKKGEEVANSNKFINDSKEYAKKVKDDIKNSEAKRHFDDIADAVDSMTKEDREKLREKLNEADRAAKETLEDVVHASKEKFEEWKKSEDSEDCEGASTANDTAEDKKSDSDESDGN